MNSQASARLTVRLQAAQSCPAHSRAVPGQGASSTVAQRHCAPLESGQVLCVSLDSLSKLLGFYQTREHCKSVMQVSCQGLGFLQSGLTQIKAVDKHSNCSGPALVIPRNHLPGDVPQLIPARQTHDHLKLSFRRTSNTCGLVVYPMERASLRDTSACTHASPGARRHQSLVCQAPRLTSRLCTDLIHRLRARAGIETLSLTTI